MQTHLRTDWNAAKYLNFFFVDFKQARGRERPLAVAGRPAVPGPTWKIHKNNNNEDEDIHNSLELQSELEFPRERDTLKLLF